MPPGRALLGGPLARGVPGVHRRVDPRVPRPVQVVVLVPRNSREWSDSPRRSGWTYPSMAQIEAWPGNETTTPFSSHRLTPAWNQSMAWTTPSIP